MLKCGRCLTLEVCRRRYQALIVRCLGLGFAKEATRVAEEGAPNADEGTHNAEEGTHNANEGTQNAEEGTHNAEGTHVAGSETGAFTEGIWN